MTDSCQDNEEADDTIKYRLEEFKRRAINLHDARAMREEVERRIRDELTLEQV